MPDLGSVGNAFVEIAVDLGQLTKGFAKAEAQLAAFAQNAAKAGTARLALDTSRFDAGVKRVGATLSRALGRPQVATVTADTSGVDRGIAQARRVVQGFAGEGATAEVSVEADAGDALREIERVGQAVAEVVERHREIGLDLDMAGFTAGLREALGQLDRFEGQAERSAAQSGNRVSRALSAGFRGLGTALTAPFRSLQGMMGSLEGRLTALAGTVGAFSVGRGIVDANVQFERLQASLKTVTGSAERGKQAFDELVKFAAETPFDLNQAVEGFISLKARGIEPTIETLRSFGNTASSLGKPLSQFIEAVADAATGEMTRLQEFGIVARQEGDRVAFTFQGVTTVVGRNAKEITAYLESIGNTKFAGAMTDQMNTLGGLFSNMGDAFNQFQVAIGTAGANEGLRDLLKALLDVQAAGKPLATVLGEQIGGALTKLAGLVREATEWFNGLTPETQKLVIQATALAGAFALIAAPLGLVVAGIAALASPVGLAIAGVLALAGAYLAFKQKIDKFAAETADRLGRFWDRQVEDFRWLGEQLGITGELVAAFSAEWQRQWQGVRVDPAAIADFQRFIGEVDASLARVGLSVEDFKGEWQRQWAGVRIDPAAIEDFKRFAADLDASLAQAGLGVGDFQAEWRRQWVTVRIDPQAIADFQAFFADIKAGFAEWRATAASEVERFKAAMARLGAIVRDPIGAFRELTTAAKVELERLAEGIKTWLVEKMTAPVAAVKEKVEQVKGFFRDLYNDVIGNSSIPDTINGVRDWVAKLKGYLSDPVKFATDQAAANFRKLATSSVQALDQVWSKRLPALPAVAAPAQAGPTKAAAAALKAPPVPPMAAKAPDTSFMHGPVVTKPLPFGSGVDPSKGTAEGQSRVAALQREIAELQRLQAAQKKGAAAYRETEIAIAAERAAREASLDPMKGQGKEIAGLVAQQERLQDTLDRAEGARSIQDDIAGLQRLAGAAGQSAAASEAMQRKIAAENAVRAQGLDLKSKEGQALYKLALQQEALNDAVADAEALRGLQEQVSDLSRLAAAYEQGNAAGERMRRQLAAEAAVRQQGLTLTSRQGQAVYQAALAQEELNAQLERTKQLQGLGQEIADLERLAQAAAKGADAYAQMQSRLAGEQAARGLGLDPGSAEGQTVVRRTGDRDQAARRESAAQSIGAIRDEIAALAELDAATRLSNEAGEGTAQRLDRERAAREATIGLAGEERDTIRGLLAQRDAYNASIERSKRINDLKAEVSDLERLQAAQYRGAAAYAQVQLAIEKERAVRELGVGATVEEIRATEELTERLFRLQQASQRATYDPFAGAGEAIKGYIQQATEYGRIAGEVVGGMLKDAEDALFNFFKTGEFSLKDFLANLTDQLLRFAAQQVVMQIMQMFMGGIGSMFAPAAGQQLPAMIGGPGGMARPYALGGVPPGRGLRAYSGRIVDRPTIFPFARGIGLMGEAGPEAILPLMRGPSGYLGVRATSGSDMAGPGGGGGEPIIQIIDQRPAGSPPIQPETQRGSDGRMVTRLVIRGEVSSALQDGSLDRAMDTRYGIKPAVR